MKSDFRNPYPPVKPILNPCPRHPTQALEKWETHTNSYWEYYKCPVQDCFVRCGLGNVEHYLNSSKRQLDNYYLQLPLDKMKCYCDKNLYMSMSNSDKNPGRLYLRCPQRYCNFFQWIVQSPNRKTRAWLEEGRKVWLETALQQGIKRIINQHTQGTGPFEGNWTPKDLSSKEGSALERIIPKHSNGNTPFEEQWMWGEFTPKERLYMERGGMAPQK